MHRIKGVLHHVHPPRPRLFGKKKTAPSDLSEESLLLANEWLKIDSPSGDQAQQQQPHQRKKSRSIDLRRRSQWLTATELERLADSLSMEDLLAEVPRDCDPATCDLMESIVQTHDDLRLAQRQLNVLCSTNPTLNVLDSTVTRFVISAVTLILIIANTYWAHYPPATLLLALVLVLYINVRPAATEHLPLVLQGIEKSVEHVEKATGKLTTILAAHEGGGKTPARVVTSPTTLLGPAAAAEEKQELPILQASPRRLRLANLFYNNSGGFKLHEQATVADYFDLLNEIECPGVSPKMTTLDWPLRSAYFRFSMSEATKSLLRSRLTKALKERGVSEDQYHERHCVEFQDLMRNVASYYYPGALLFNSYTIGPLHERVQAFYDFETDVFRGRLICRAAGFDHIPSAAKTVALFFGGKRRVMQFVCQGVLKKDVCARSLLTGQIFRKPLKLPPAILVRMAMMFMRSFNSVQADDITSTTHPYFISPFITSCQTVNIADPNKGQVPPDIGSPTDIVEDCTALGGDLAGPAGLDGRLRRKYFSSLENLNRTILRKDLVYTFESYQHQFRFDNFQFDLGVRTMDVNNYLNDQPIEVSCFLDDRLGERFFGIDRKRGDNGLGDADVPTNYLWRLEIFSRRAVENQTL